MKKTTMKRTARPVSDLPVLSHDTVVGGATATATDKQPYYQVRLDQVIISK